MVRWKEGRSTTTLPSYHLTILTIHLLSRIRHQESIMRRFRRFVLSGLFTAVLAPIAAAGGQQSTTPPMAQRRPHRLEMHGDVRVDDYFWLRERENPR